MLQAHTGHISDNTQAKSSTLRKQKQPNYQLVE